MNFVLSKVSHFLWLFLAFNIFFRFASLTCKICANLRQKFPYHCPSHWFFYILSALKIGNSPIKQHFNPIFGFSPFASEKSPNPLFLQNSRNLFNQMRYLCMCETMCRKLPFFALGLLNFFWYLKFLDFFFGRCKFLWWQKMWRCPASIVMR